MRERHRDSDRRERERLASEWERLQSVTTPASVGYESSAPAATLVEAGPRGCLAGDAPHLAIATCRGLSLATLDRDPADAADPVGLEVALRPPD